ncbi:hypothetical protein Dimus_024469 [Dionaea muscipula]
MEDFVYLDIALEAYPLAFNRLPRVVVALRDRCYYAACATAVVARSCSSCCGCSCCRWMGATARANLKARPLPLLAARVPVAA